MATGGQALNRPTLPAGYRFSPNNDDLIVYYLKRKVLGQQLPADIIPTTDVYASSPNKLPLGGEPNEWFFFSTRSKDDDVIELDGGYYAIDPEGAGPITWEGKTVGYVKTLNFYKGSSPDGKETEWMVEELRVNPEFVPVDNDDRSTQEKKTLLHAKSLECSLNLNGRSNGGQALNVPVLVPGYRFIPTDDELIVYYLKRKIMGQQLPCDVIPTIDVYASNPDKLPLGGEANEWFFFSTRSKDDDVIVLDGGYYAIDPEGAGPITWEGKTVGYVKTLNFYKGSSPDGKETEWMVEELRVNPEFVPVDNDDRSTQEKIENLVACRVSRVQPETEWYEYFDEEIEKEAKRGKFEIPASLLEE
uniref:NAC domain-containing protein n=1 Tax=Salix viminalis TaxID=40686 RepID=A0A6N2K9Q3_SALVM